MTASRGNKDKTRCPVCTCSLSEKNYASHMRKVHGADSADGVPRSQTFNTGMRAQARKLEFARKKRTRRISIAAAALLVVIAGMGWYLSSDKEKPGPTPLQQSPPQVQNGVLLSASQLSTSAQFYSYSADGTIVRYFAAIGSDGNVHVGTDACDVCYTEKRGYRQVGDVMKCNNCGKEFRINSIGTENLSGGCWPSYLPATTSGDDITIRFSDLKAKGYMFA